MSYEESGQNHEHVVKNKDEAERKFGCPCGKWYLSYPALFTHVKQKHQGKAPGQLIKPKTDKTRGRPRLPTHVQITLIENNEEDNSIITFDCVDQLQKAISNKQIDYQDEYEYSEGSITCQDMGSDFLRIMGGSGQQKKLLTCFINYLKFFVGKKYQDGYWQKHRPGDLVDIVNDLIRQHQSYSDIFPLEKETLADLVFVLFYWMHKNKWTDHKILRRNVEQQDTIKN